MLKAIDIASYFINKDTDRLLFNKEFIHKNGRGFYEGNARLNKYLHLAQNIYIAKTGGKLFNEDLYAYDNGGVVLSVQENYSILLNTKRGVVIPEDVCIFLDKIYKIFENASIDELIELSHEDNEWENKRIYHMRKEDQKMDSLSHVDEYKEQYHDIIKVMDRMVLWKI